MYLTFNGRAAPHMSPKESQPSMYIQYMYSTCIIIIIVLALFEKSDSVL